MGSHSFTCHQAEVTFLPRQLKQFMMLLLIWVVVVWFVSTIVKWLEGLITRKLKSSGSSCLHRNRPFIHVNTVFGVSTMRSYASMVLAVIVCLRVCLCVCPSVTNWYYIQIARQSRMVGRQAAPHDSPGTLVFWCQRSNSWSVYCIMAMFMYY